MNILKVKPFFCFFCISIQTFAYAAEAESIEEKETLPSNFSSEVDVGIAFISHQNQNFGSTQTIYNNHAPKDGDRLEWYIKPTVQYQNIINGLNYELTFSPIATGTWGDLDGLAMGKKDTSAFDVAQLSVNLKKENFLNIHGLNQGLYLGKQEFILGNSFAVGSGRFVQGKEGAVWIAKNKSFDWTTALKSSYQDFEFNLFYLKGRFDFDILDTQEKVKLTGANLEYKKDKKFFGLMYFGVQDNGSESRDGLKVRNVYFKHPVSFINDQLTLELDYAHQENKKLTSALEAEGYSSRLSYEFQQFKYTPKVSYRWTKFSKNYDALTYGSTGEWGDWYQGEIIGNYMLFNSDQTTQSVKLELYPTGFTRVGVIYYDHDSGLLGKHENFAQELNAYFDYYPSDKLSTGILFGVAKPQKVAIETFGKDKKSYLVEAYLSYKF